jgi:hypothetical protein
VIGNRITIVTFLQTILSLVFNGVLTFVNGPKKSTPLKTRLRIVCRNVTIVMRLPITRILEI